MAIGSLLFNAGTSTPNTTGWKNLTAFQPFKPGVPNEPDAPPSFPDPPDGPSGPTPIPPGGATPPTTPPTTGGGGSYTTGDVNNSKPTKDWSRDQVREWVTNYYKSRNTSPFATSVDYWTDKFFSPEFNGDTTYWMQRLSIADEFGGGGAFGSGGIGSFAPPSSQFPPINFQSYSGGSPVAIPSASRSIPAGFSVPTNNPMLSLAEQLVQQLTQQGPTDTEGQKEEQKELLLALRDQGMDVAQQSAASRGISGGWLEGREADLQDAFSGDLTSAYRDIMQEAEQQDFQNLLATQGAAQGLGGLQFQQELANKQLGLDAALGFGNLDTSRMALQIQQMLGLRQDETSRLELELRRQLGMGDLDLRAALGSAGLNNDFWKIVLGL